MQIPADFNHSMAWLVALNERALISADPAVYVLTHENAFARLRGSSQLLYIGSTGQLGGDSQSCRLRIYRYPNGQHALELRRRVQLLLGEGVQITIHWKHLSSPAEASQQEARLLSQYAKEHHELPPFNGRNERVL